MWVALAITLCGEWVLVFWLGWELEIETGLVKFVIAWCWLIFGRHFNFIYFFKTYISI